MNGPRRTALAFLLAILGIVLAAAITWGTSQLVSQHIGLASEPLTAGSALLPRYLTVTSPAGNAAPAPTRKTPTVTVTRPVPVRVPTATATAPAPSPPVETPAAPEGSTRREGSTGGEGSGSEGDRQVHRDD